MYLAAQRQSSLSCVDITAPSPLVLVGVAAFRVAIDEDKIEVVVAQLIVVIDVVLLL
jgi:hypothetical protein